MIGQPMKREQLIKALQAISNEYVIVQLVADQPLIDYVNDEQSLNEPFGCEVMDVYDNVIMCQLLDR